MGTLIPVGCQLPACRSYVFHNEESVNMSGERGPCTVRTHVGGGGLHSEVQVKQVCKHVWEGLGPCIEVWGRGGGGLRPCVVGPPRWIDRHD